MGEFLRMQNITKIYGNGILANDKVNLSINHGEIHAIAGENGAGKSTIMKILYGIERADYGEIYIDGRKVDIKSPIDAMSYGIGMVHQHFMLVDSLKIYENIYLGAEKSRKGVLDKEQMIKQTTELAQKYNMNVDPNALCADLPVGVKQKVEILKVLARGAKVIILDEPTAVLTPLETEEFFNQLQKLKEDDCTICIITHKLKEIKQICDRVTIMQKGKNKGVFDVKDISEEEISRLMVGKDVELKVKKEKCQPKETVLKIENLTVMDSEGKKVVNNVSFNVRKNEIVCLAGVEGNGQRETIKSITGLNKEYVGNIYIENENIKKFNIRTIREKGLSFIPEDRMIYGVSAQSSIYDNMIAYKTTQKKNTKLGFIKSGNLKKTVEKLIKDYKIKCDNQSQQINMLSGGNIQKVVVAREIEINPKILIADQPTRGVDVGAIELIHKRLVDLRDENKAILLVSADLTEVFNLADKILVFNNGQITGGFNDTQSLTEEKIGEYMLGLKKMSAQELEKVIND